MPGNCHVPTVVHWLLLCAVQDALFRAFPKVSRQLMQVVHRDLKTKNILLTADNKVAKIADIGALFPNSVCTVSGEAKSHKVNKIAART